MRQAGHAVKFNRVVAEKVQQRMLTPHGILVAEFDERLAITWLEEQVAQQRRTGIPAAAPQEESQTAWQFMRKVARNLVEVATRGDRQRLYRAQTELRSLPYLIRNERESAIDALQALQVRCQTVDKSTVQHMPRHLRDTGRTGRRNARAQVCAAVDADH